MQPKVNALKLSRVVLDISVGAILTVASLIWDSYSKPFVRGFFLDDESIMYPYKGSTVSYNLLVALSAIIPAIVMLVCELVIHFRTDSRHHSPAIQLIPGYVISSWFISTYRVVGVHLIGMAVTELATDIPKTLVGRLRPHFLAVCKPDVNLLNQTSGYIIANICTGDPNEIFNARLSFPSGHSSMALYAGASIILYLSHRLRPWPICRMPVLLADFVFLYLAGYVAMSRLSDYKHHWSDVLVGSLLGIIVAALMTFVFGGRMSPYMTQPSDEDLEEALLVSKRSNLNFDNSTFRSQELQAA